MIGQNYIPHPCVCGAGWTLPRGESWLAARRNSRKYDITTKDKAVKVDLLAGVENLPENASRRSETWV